MLFLFAKIFICAIFHAFSISGLGYAGGMACYDIFLCRSKCEKDVPIGNENMKSENGWCKWKAWQICKEDMKLKMKCENVILEGV